jgi:hypothetical protein
MEQIDLTFPMVVAYLGKYLTSWLRPSH